jgi:Holliday junction resolvase RusA-like endonuclease
MDELRVEIGGIPPSVGHYNAYRAVVPRGRTPGKPFVHCYPTDQAKAWWRTVAAAVHGRQVRGEGYSVSFVVFLPTLQVRDVDNFSKCILDSLVQAGAIDNDGKVEEIHGYRRLDRANPRTVVVIRTAQKELL